MRRRLSLLALLLGTLALTPARSDAQSIAVLLRARVPLGAPRDSVERALVASGWRRAADGGGDLVGTVAGLDADGAVDMDGARARAIRIVGSDESLLPHTNDLRVQRAYNALIDEISATLGAPVECAPRRRATPKLERDMADALRLGADDQWVIWRLKGVRAGVAVLEIYAWRFIAVDRLAVRLTLAER